MRKLLERALVENIQRADLNAIEEATAYQLLIDQFKLTQEELAQRVGRAGRPSRTRCGCCGFPRRSSRDSWGAKSPWATPGRCFRSRNPSNWRWPRHRQTRPLRTSGRADGPAPPQPAAPKTAAPDSKPESAAHKLEQRWKTRVDIVRNGAGGRIVFHFSSEDELDRLFGELMGE